MKKDIIYITSYLSSKYDYHREQQITPDDFTYIKNYYESITDNNIKSHIIVDNSSDEFINQYTNTNVSFCKTEDNLLKFICNKNLLNTIHVHDIRFMYYLAHIMNTHHEYYVLTDSNDVIILNPIDNIVCPHHDKLYVGTEPDKILDNKWFIETFFKLSSIQSINEEECKKIFHDRQMINCGVICGGRDTLIKVLQKTINIMIHTYLHNNIKRPIDMFMFNYVIYKYFTDIICFDSNFTTRFGGNEMDKTKCIKHR